MSDPLANKQLQALDAPQQGSISARARASTGAPYLVGLNSEQREAVESLDGPVLVLAGAGTGKTRVLTTRIAHILCLGRARPSEILSVTFTNKAAREMKIRIAGMVGAVVEGMPWLGTFHSIGVKILRRHAELVGLKPDFTILDTDDQIRLLKQLIAAENIDEKRWPARVLAGIIDGWKNRGLTPAQVRPGEAASFAGGRGLELYAAYQARLKVLNAADFGDLLLECLRLFREHPEVLRQYQERFKYILVDEYQDTNVAQYLWLRLLAQRQSQAGSSRPHDGFPSPLGGEGAERASASEAGEGEQNYRESLAPSPGSPALRSGEPPSPPKGEGAPKNICCVGDDDQSIYGWRGAEVDNILRFEHDFPGAKVIRLERNYRSTGHILAAASYLIAHNEGRLGKTLRTDGEAGEKVAVTAAWDSEEEARAIGEEIEELQRSGHKLDEMAILVRASFQMREFEDRFVTMGLNYRVIGGPRFYERMEIRDALAYLRLVNQPADDLAFERIVNKPKRGLGDATIKTLHDHARARNIPLMEATRALIATDELKPKPRATLRDLIASFDRWRAQKDTLPHTELAEAVLDESGYTEMWQNDKSADAAGRLENLKEFVRSMEEFENLAGFLEHVSLVMDADGGANADAVSIMTLHAAKGLEFDTIFLPGWEEGLLPHQRSLDDQGRTGLEEERRLAHVGLTRARKRAKIYFVSNRRMHGSWTSAIPSRFIDELPPDHVAVADAKGNFGGFGGGSRFDSMDSFDSDYSTPGWRRAQQTRDAPRGRKRFGDGFGEDDQSDFAGGGAQDRAQDRTQDRTDAGEATSSDHLSPAGRGRPRAARPGEGAPSPARGAPARKRSPLTIDGTLAASGAALFCVGQRVFHMKFGNGNVTAVDGNKLTIAFDRAGEKRVVDSFVERV